MNLYITKMKVYIWTSIISVIQLAIFSGLWYYYWSHPMFKCPCLKYQQSFPIAKASAMLININLFFMTISYIKLWRKFIYISYHILQSLHYYFAISFLTWSVIHVVAHYINFLKTNSIVELLEWGVGLTGNLVVISLILLVILMSFKSIKENNYSTYITIHYVLAFIIMTLIIIHGTFCTIKYNNDTCPQSTTWIWLSIPFIIVISETIYKYMFNSVYIKRVIRHNDNLVELQLPLPKKYCGKTIWINSFSINPFEWHPFTVNKWNGYQNTCSIHIKIRGDWTSKLNNRLLDDSKSILLHTNGPYHCLQKDFLNNIIAYPTLLVATGIGITNFAYPLKRLSDNPSVIKSKITMIIILKSPDEINWMLKTFSLLQKHIEFIFYFTEILKSEFPFEYRLGRPEFENIMDYLVLQTIFTERSRINIYYSGLQGIVKHIKRASNQNDTFNYHT